MYQLPPEFGMKREKKLCCEGCPRVMLTMNDAFHEACLKNILQCGINEKESSRKEENETPIPSHNPFWGNAFWGVSLCPLG